MSQAFKDFVKGMGQALDLGATMSPRTSSGGLEADSDALRGDWNAIGGDMKRSMSKVKRGQR